MKKKNWLLPVSIISGFILLCILLLIVTVCIIGIKGYGISKGRLYLAEKHTYLIDDRDMAMLVSDQSKKGNLFQGYESGDEVLIVHDGVEETYPSRTGAYYVILTAKGDGTYEPTDEVLGLHNILTETHSHQPAAKAQTVSDPVSGYCGNTQTTIYFEDGSSHTFMYGHSVTLTDILVNLDYDPDKMCKCLPEYKVDTEFGKDYGISLSGSYARCEKEQAELTEEQIETIKKIIEWAKEDIGVDFSN